MVPARPLVDRVEWGLERQQYATHRSLVAEGSVKWAFKLTHGNRQLCPDHIRLWSRIAVSQERKEALQVKVAWGTGAFGDPWVRKRVQTTPPLAER
jgi:hypothetical protein